MRQRVRADNMTVCYRWIHRYFDNVMMKLMIDNRTDAWKTDVNLLNSAAGDQAGNVSSLANQPNEQVPNVLQLLRSVTLDICTKLCCH